jgi:hypothetical protein
MIGREIQIRGIPGMRQQTQGQGGGTQRAPAPR